MGFRLRCVFRTDIPGTPGSTIGRNASGLFEQTAVETVTPQLRRKILPAVANIKDSVCQMARGTVLKKVGIGAGTHHFANNIVVRGASQNHNFRAQCFTADAPNEFYTMEFGQIQIDHRHVRAELPDLPHGCLAVRTLRYNLELCVSLEHCGEPVAAEGILVSQQNRYFFRGGH
jgi:hypothetical protein